MMLLRLIIHLTVFLVGTSVAHALTTPERGGWVTDEAGIIDPQTESELAGALTELQRSTGAEVVVVTLKSLQGASIETWGDVLGESWSIGRSGGKDKGALLIVAPNDRKVRIAVGYGLGDRLSDGAAVAIVSDVILPSFRRGDFTAGIRSGVDSIAAKIEGRAVATTLAVERSPSPAVTTSPSRGAGSSSSTAMVVAIGLVIVPALFLIVLIMRKLGDTRSGSSSAPASTSTSASAPVPVSTPTPDQMPAPWWRWNDDEDDNGILGILLSNRPQGSSWGNRRSSSASWSSSRSSSSSGSRSWSSSSSSSSSSGRSRRSFGGGASGSW
jgi:uncharacterized membrane protein YgcG